MIQQEGPCWQMGQQRRRTDRKSPFISIWAWTEREGKGAGPLAQGRAPWAGLGSLLVGSALSSKHQLCSLSPSAAPAHVVTGSRDPWAVRFQKVHEFGTLSTRDSAWSSESQPGPWSQPAGSGRAKRVRPGGRLSAISPQFGVKSVVCCWLPQGTESRGTFLRCLPF